MPICPNCGKDRGLALNEERSLFECLDCNHRYHKFGKIAPTDLQFRVDERKLDALPFEVQKLFYEINERGTA